MSKATTYKSDPLAAVHETASDMFEAGVIDKQIMRHFDESCLTPIHPFSAEEIKALRERRQKKPYSNPPRA
jgi:putative transcriptional regulator